MVGGGDAEAVGGRFEPASDEDHGPEEQDGDHGRSDGQPGAHPTGVPQQEVEPDQRTDDTECQRIEPQQQADRGGRPARL